MHRVLGVFLVLCLTACSLFQRARSGPVWVFQEVPPKRLLVLVFDQMRPDFIDRFQLTHFKRLQQHSLNLKNARVGHLTSNTIVSHPVIATGLFPKNLPWSDEVFFDDKQVLGKRKQFYANMEFSLSDYPKIWKDVSPSLLKTVPGPKASKLVVAQKHYTAYTFSSPTTESRILTLGPIRKNEPLKGWREPAGSFLLQEYLEPFGGRFFLDANPDYGSKNSVYPFDGNRYVLGKDPQHPGGDAWVKDALLTFFRKEPQWTAALASFGSVDKSLHAFGEHQTKTQVSWALEHDLHLEKVLKLADQYLGEILDFLEEEELLSETLIILTSDHGGQNNEQYFGHEAPIGNHLDWISGKTNFEALPPHLKPLVKRLPIEALVRDSALRLYLKNKSLQSALKAVQETRKLPGVAEIYYKKEVSHRFYYIRAFRSPSLTGKSLEWAKENHPALLQTMANRHSADVVILFQEGVGYGFPGDHGGTQESVQRIPMMIWSSNLRKDNPVLLSQILQAPVRLVDIHPMVKALMKLPSEENEGNLDGTSWGIEGLVH